MQSMTVYLNDIVKGHLIEDALCTVIYKVYQPEPDVGRPEIEIVIDRITTDRGRILSRIFEALSDQAVEDITNQIYWEIINV